MSYRARSARRREKTMKNATAACRLHSSRSLSGMVKILAHSFTPALTKAWNRPSLLVDAMTLAGAPGWIKTSLHHRWISRETALRLARAP